MSDATALAPEPPLGPLTRAAPAPRAVPAPSVVLELLKPVTWFPPMWAFLCGVVSSGASWQGRGLAIAAGVLLAGPLVCAMSQAINDWCDRHVDAINEPHRPIPSGRMPGRWGLYIAFIWTAASLAVAWALGAWVFAGTAVGLAMAWAYSAPPLRLKRDGWTGGLACAFSYEGLAWFTGAALMLQAWPPAAIVALAVLYSLGAHGIMTLNDFKSVAGDREMGVRTLPVRYGEAAAARIASAAMVLPQLVVVALLLSWGAHVHGLIVALLVALQALAMARYLLREGVIAADPRGNAARYNGTGVALYVTGMMVSAHAVAGLAAGAA